MRGGLNVRAQFAVCVEPVKVWYGVDGAPTVHLKPVFLLPQEPVKVWYGVDGAPTVQLSQYSCFLRSQWRCDMVLMEPLQCS